MKVLFAILLFVSYNELFTLNASLSKVNFCSVLTKTLLEDKLRLLINSLPERLLGSGSSLTVFNDILLFLLISFISGK